MCSLRFENNLLTVEAISKKTPFSKLSFAFVLLALPLLIPTVGVKIGEKFRNLAWEPVETTVNEMHPYRSKLVPISAMALRSAWERISQLVLEIVRPHWF